MLTSRRAESSIRICYQLRCVTVNSFTAIIANDVAVLSVMNSASMCHVIGISISPIPIVIVSVAVLNVGNGR